MLAFAPSTARPLLAKTGSVQARAGPRAASVRPQAFLNGLLQRVGGGGSSSSGMSTAAAKEEVRPRLQAYC